MKLDTDSGPRWTVISVAERRRLGRSPGRSRGSHRRSRATRDNPSTGPRTLTRDKPGKGEPVLLLADEPGLAAEVERILSLHPRWPWIHRDQYNFDLSHSPYELRTNNKKALGQRHHGLDSFSMISRRPRTPGADHALVASGHPGHHRPRRAGPQPVFVPAASRMSDEMAWPGFARRAQVRTIPEDPKSAKRRGFSTFMHAPG